MDYILEIQNLKHTILLKWSFKKNQYIRAVDNITLKIKRTNIWFSR